MYLSISVSRYFILPLDYKFEVQILDALHVYAASELSSAFINIDIDMNKATI